MLTKTEERPQQHCRIITKQPVGSQHHLGLGKTFAQMFFKTELTLVASGISMISMQDLIKGSSIGLYNSESFSLLKEGKNVF